MTSRHWILGIVTMLTPFAGCDCGGETPSGPDASIVRYDGGGTDTAIAVDAAVNDATQPDTALADAAQPDMALPDAGGQDLAVADAAQADTASGDAATSTDSAVICTGTNECGQAGALRCEGNAVVTCEVNPSDGCLTWSAAVACEQGTTCSNGKCEASCTDECSESGASRCASNEEVELCGQYDADDCLDWGGAHACAGGTICSNGVCAGSCTNECTEGGARRCAANSVEECGDVDTDPCFEWTIVETCADTATCSSGACTTRCSDDCSTVGALECSGTGFHQCGDYDDDDCLEWGTTVACTAGTVCSGGICRTDCFDDCPNAGALGCQGNAARECGNYDTDSCLEWGTATQCPDGTTCSNGVCAQTCQNECTVAGNVECAGSGSRTCGNYDGDPCLEWSDVKPCGPGTSCSNGICMPACSDECSAGQQRCSGDSALQDCGTNYDADPCWDWGPPLACAADETCTEPTANAAVCATGCVDTCAQGTPTTCYTGLETLSCVQGAGGCWSWSVEACAAGEGCVGTACQGCAADALEVNDDEFSATVVGQLPFAQASLSICQPDLDWFVYTATAGQNVLVEISFQQVLGDLDLNVYNPSLDLVAVGWSTTDNERAVINNTVAGDYLIAVFGYDYGRGIGDSNNYGLNISTISCSDECHIEGVRHCTDDNIRATCADVNGDGCLEAEAGGFVCPAGTACADGICEPCEDECINGDGGCGWGLEYLCQLPSANHTCWMYQMARECFATEMCGTGNNCIACAADSGEANEEIGTATAAVFGTQSNLTLCAGDRDFYAVTVPAGHTLGAVATFTTSIEPGFTTDDGHLFVNTYDGAGVLVGGSTGYSGDEAQFANNTASPLQAYVEVVGYEDSTNTYSLTLTDLGCSSACINFDTRCSGAQIETCGDSNADGCFEWGAAQACPSGYSCLDNLCQWSCNADTYEGGSGNDDSATATVLSVPGSAGNLTLCDADIDWFQFAVPAQSSVAVEVTPTVGAIDLYAVQTDGSVTGYDGLGDTIKTLVISNPTVSPRTMYAATVSADGLAVGYGISTSSESCLNECAWNGFLDCQDAATLALCYEGIDDTNACYHWAFAPDWSEYVETCAAGQTCVEGNGCVYNCAPDSHDVAAPGNNTFEDATALSFGSSTGLTLCAGDEDYFVVSGINLNDRVRATALIGTPFDQGDLDIFVYDIVGTLVGYSASTHSTEMVEFTARKAGDFYVDVVLHAGSYASYGLNLELNP